MVALTDKRYANALFVDFSMLLHDYGVPASPRDILELNRALEKGLVEDLDDLLVLLRLIFVRHVEQMDAFERAFAFYFFGIDLPPVSEGDFALFQTKQFREWLQEAIKRGDIPETFRWTMTPEELMEKFWERIREQMKGHDGGNKWVGTGGTSPFGHSGFSEGGVRVYGESKNRSALKVIGDRRYISYADANTLRGDNLRQALESMRHLQRVGAHSELNLDATIRETVHNCGDISLVFEREHLDRMKVVLLIDNGGDSMRPHVDITRLLFGKLHDRFEEIQTYFFHNTLYEKVWKDEHRRIPLDTEKLLQMRDDRRFIIIGDATMAPEELEFSRGALYYGAEDDRPSVYWLSRIAERFPHTVWLNPIPKAHWDTTYGTWTVTRIREFFHMEDLTLGGIKNMVQFLSEV